MKTRCIVLIVALVMGEGLAAPILAADSRVTDTAGSLEDSTGAGQAHGVIRQIFSAAKQRFQAFRQETPLSAEQKQKVRAVLESHRTEIRTQMEKSRDARRAMAAAAKANGPEASATRQAAEKIGEAARDRALLRARISSEIRPILTPEQQKRIEEAHTEIEEMVDRRYATSVKP